VHPPIRRHSHFRHCWRLHWHHG